MSDGDSKVNAAKRTPRSLDAMQRGKRNFLLGGFGVALALIARASTEQNFTVGFVGDIYHYFELNHKKLLDAVGTQFLSDRAVIARRFPVVYEEPEHLEAVCRVLSQSPPKLLVAIGGVEASRVSQACPSVPLVFVTDFDPVASGLMEPTSHGVAPRTGLSYDNPLHTTPVSLVAAALRRRGRVLVVANTSWLNTSGRAELWTAAATGNGINLEYVAVDGFEQLHQMAVWQTPTRYDAWILPMGLHLATHGREIVAHLNAHRVLGCFEKFLFVRAGAPLGWEDTIYEWIEPIAQYLRLVIDGVPPSTIPVLAPDTWGYAANAAALRTLGVRLSDEGVALLTTVY